MRLYFAYGSNLDWQNWSEFCARHDADPACIKPIGPASLPDRELVFNYRSVLRAGGALNIRERKGHFVHGALFEVSERGWEILDIKESVAIGCYERVDHVAISHGGRTQPVVTYKVTAQRTEGFVPPCEEYHRIVARGLASFGHPMHQLEAAAADRRAEPEVNGVFVYGTLMRGERHHDVLRRHGPGEVRQARSRGRLHATCEDYPMLDLDAVLDADEPHERDHVRGEFVNFPDTAPVLEALDELEDFYSYGHHRNEYVRTLVEVDTDRTGSRLAWTYVAANKAMMRERIESGCWRTHRGVEREKDELALPA